MRTARLAPALFAALPALAFSQVVVTPPRPIAFEPVALRITASPCDVDPATVFARHESGAIHVGMNSGTCQPMDGNRVIEVRLGALPPGDYRIGVTRLVGGDLVVVVAEPFTLTVTDRPAITIFPPPRRPAADHSGAWWVPAESGWGLSIQQSATDTLFAQLFVYGADSRPAWYTFQGGSWKSATRWEGTVYATTGPSFANPAFDPAQVGVRPVGPVSLEFEQAPGSEGVATLAYTVDGATVTKRIRRLLP